MMGLKENARWQDVKAHPAMKSSFAFLTLFVDNGVTYYLPG